jgi:hypothetical protein
LGRAVASKQGRETAYWVGMMRQVRQGAAALRTGTAAVVARVGQSSRGWCAVFRGGVGSKETAAGVRDEVRCRIETKLTLQRTSGCVVVGVSPAIHSASTGCPLSPAVIARVSQQVAAAAAAAAAISGAPGRTGTCDGAASGSKA